MASTTPSSAAVYNRGYASRGHSFQLRGQVPNVGDKANYLSDSLNGYNTKNGQISVTLDSMLPIIPSAGVLIER